MEFVAHRGCAGQFPENTRRAVRASAPHVDRIELDVRRCGSGELVVHHGDDLAEKTDAQGRVHETRVDALEAVDVLGSGEGIPRLDAVLDDVPAAVDLQFDLKHEGLVADVADVVARRSHDIYACSVHLSVLERVRDAGLAFGYVSFPYFEDRPVSDEEIARIDYDDVVATTADLGCAFVEAPVELCLRTAFVADAQDAGLDVIAYSVETPGVAERVRAAGVDGLMLNRYDVLEGTAD